MFSSELETRETSDITTLHVFGLMYIHATPFWVTSCMTSVRGRKLGRLCCKACNYLIFCSILCNKHWNLVITVFCMVIESHKLQNQSSFTCTCSKNRMLRNYGIDPHRRLSILLTRPSTCYKAQYVRNCKSSLSSVPEQTGTGLALYCPLILWDKRHAINRLSQAWCVFALTCSSGSTLSQTSRSAERKGRFFLMSIQKF